MIKRISTPGFLGIFLGMLLGWMPLQANPEAIFQDARIVAAKEHLIHFRFADAERILRPMVKNEKDELTRAVAAYHLATMASWRYFFDPTNDNFEAYKLEADRFRSETRYLADVKWRRFLTGEAAFQKAGILSIRNDMLNAAMSAREAYNAYTKCIEEFPDFVEVQKSMGIMEVMIGSAPRTVRGLLSVVGFSGDVQVGLDHLMVSAQKSQWVREEAIMFYAFMDESLNDARRNGVHELEALVQKNPESPMLNYVLGYLYRNLHMVDQAVPLLEKSVRDRANKSVFSPAMFDYYLADAYFRQNRLDEAIQIFRRFIQDFAGTSLKSAAWLRIGWALELKGDRAGAIVAYQHVQDDASNSDENAYRQSKIRVQTPMTPVEKLLLQTQNAADAGHNDEAIQLATQIIEDQTATPVNRAEAHYRLGQALQRKGQFAEALLPYQKAVDEPGDPLAKWGPYSQFYIGECLEALGRKNEAIAAYRKTLNYKEKFDYHVGLEQQARAALSRVNARS